MNKKMLLFPMTLVLYEVATYLSNDMYLPSLPSLEQDFQVNQQMAQYTLLTWFLGSASMHLFMGPLSDRFGRRVVLLSGGVFFVVTSIICALTENIMVMLLARFIQGCTVCSMVVAGYSAVHELHDTKTAIKIIAIMGSVTVLAPALGPILGAVITLYAHWRFIFVLLAVWGAITIMTLFKVMPETNLKRLPINTKKIIQDYKSILQNKDFLRFSLTLSFVFLSVICWIVESPFLIIEQYQQSSITYGLIQLLVFGCFILGAQVTNALVHKVGVIKLIGGGLSIACIGVLCLLLSSILVEDSIIWVTLAMMVVGLGVSIPFGPLNRRAIDACQEPMGARMAVLISFMNIFSVLGTFLVTLINVSAVGLSLIIASGVFLAVLVFIFMPSSRR